MNKFVSAIILAAGSSTRMGCDKMLLKIGKKTVFERTLEVFENTDIINEIIVVARKDACASFGEIVKKNGYSKVVAVVSGGENRQESVYRGMQAVSGQCEYICVHDGARPLIREKSIALVVESAIEKGGAVAAVMSVDTLKGIDEDGKIISTIDREKTVQVRTPQIFEKSILFNAHEKAREENFVGTDECMLVERLGHSIQTVITGRENIKLTYPEDVLYMTEVLRERGAL